MKKDGALSKRKFYLNFILIILCFVTLWGCSSSMMQKGSIIDISTLAQEHALVTFIRPSVFGGAIKFAIWDKENFVGILTANSYIQYKAEPGEHLFIGRAENWSYVKANLEAGKQYYIIGKVFPGFWKARVALDPVTKEDLSDQAETRKIDKWISSLNPTKIIPEKRDAYVNPRLDHIRRAINDYKSGDVKYGTIEAADGR